MLNPKRPPNASSNTTSNDLNQNAAATVAVIDVSQKLLQLQLYQKRCSIKQWSARPYCLPLQQQQQYPTRKACLTSPFPVAILKTDRLSGVSSSSNTQIADHKRRPTRRDRQKRRPTAGRDFQPKETVLLYKRLPAILQ